MISLITLACVFLSIAVRQCFPIRLPIWAIMLAGALVVLFSGQISFSQAYGAIHWNVMGYLLGVFILAYALEFSGLLMQWSARLLVKVKNLAQLLAGLIFLMGFLSALLMNDTVAIMATPLLLLIARSANISATPLLLALAFSITIGSIMSPIGNPQNLLIASQGFLHTPFLTFFTHLAFPTLLSLIITYAWIAWCYRAQLADPICVKSVPLADPKLARIARWSLLFFVVLIGCKILASLRILSWNLNFAWMALLAAFPLVLLHTKRWQMFRAIDWGTLIFFIAMFILMRSVWQTHWLQHTLAGQHHWLTLSVIFFVSVTLSQLISNVPLVALYLPVLLHHGAGESQLLALAASSTIAGNFLLLGAASNVIILQNAEKRGENGFSFWQFSRVGIPLGLINCLLYAWFLH